MLNVFHRFRLTFCNNQEATLINKQRLTVNNTMLHEEEPSLMYQRDATFVPQALKLFVRMTTPRPPGT